VPHTSTEPSSSSSSSSASLFSRSASNVARHSSVVSKSNPCLGLPRIITTLASPSHFFTPTISTFRPSNAPSRSNVPRSTTSASSRALAQSVCPRSSHVPAEFHAEICVEDTCLESASASSLVIFCARRVEIVLRRQSSLGSRSRRREPRSNLTVPLPSPPARPRRSRARANSDTTDRPWPIRSPRRASRRVRPRSRPSFIETSKLLRARRAAPLARVDVSAGVSTSIDASTSSSSSRVVDGSIARGGPATEVPSAPRTGDKSTRSVATARATSAADARDGGDRREDVERRGGRVDDARGG